MNRNRALAIVVSSVMANQLITFIPAAAATPDLNSILSAIAAKNGMVAPNTGAASVTGGSGAAMPTKADVMSAVHGLPHGISYTNGMPTPTPTLEEAATLIAPEVDFNVGPVNGVNPIFGTITQADESLTGIFDDLSNVDMSQFEPEVDPNLFNDDPNADLTNLGITSPVADVMNTITGAQATTTTTNLLESTIGLNASSTQLEVQNAAPSLSTESGGVNTADMSVLALPSMFCAPSDRPVALAETMKSPVLLQGYVEDSAEYPNFVNPNKDEEVALPHGHSVKVQRGALAWLEVGKDYVKVRAGSHGVSLSAPNGQHVNLGVGEEALWVVAGVDGYKLLDDGLAKRRVAHHELADGSTVYLSEFSIVHFLAHEDADGTESKNVRERLLKSAAAINVACRHHGRYHLVRKIALAK